MGSNTNFLKCSAFEVLQKNKQTTNLIWLFLAFLLQFPENITNW
jgi:hypothetical protein